MHFNIAIPYKRVRNVLGGWTKNVEADVFGTSVVAEGKDNLKQEVTQLLRTTIKHDGKVRIFRCCGYVLTVLPFSGGTISMLSHPDDPEGEKRATTMTVRPVEAEISSMLAHILVLSHKPGVAVPDWVFHYLTADDLHELQRRGVVEAGVGA